MSAVAVVEQRETTRARTCSFVELVTAVSFLANRFLVAEDDVGFGFEAMTPGAVVVGVPVTLVHETAPTNLRRTRPSKNVPPHSEWP